VIVPTIQCRFGHRFTTTAKPGGTTGCPECRSQGARTSVRIPVAAAPTSSPFPDQSGEWSRERPFTGLGRRPRPDGTCATCTNLTDQGSPRGTFVWCAECHGYSYDYATEGRRLAAVARIDAAELAARRARAAAAERAAVDQAPAPDLADVLDLAAEIGERQAAIAVAIRNLHDAPTEALGMQAARTAARLQALDHVVSQAGRLADPYGALDALEPYLTAELHDADRIAREIGRALADAEIEEARDARRLELIQQRQAIAAAPRLRVTPHVATWQTCQINHPRRLIRPPATLTIWLSNSEYGGPGKRLSICGQHDPEKVRQAYNYSHYTASPITAGR
jgi:hypothetical protein